MAEVICPQALNCKVAKGYCPHMEKHKAKDACRNGICEKILPASAKCVPVEVPVVEDSVPVTQSPPVTEPLESNPVHETTATTKTSQVIA